MKKTIRKLLISGSITTDPYRILSEQKRFCENLYKVKTTDSDDSVKTFLNDLNIPQLSEEQKLYQKLNHQEMMESQLSPIRIVGI